MVRTDVRYGDINEAPVLYLLTFLNAATVFDYNILQRESGVQVVYFQQLLEATAATLPSRYVILNVNTAQVDYNSDIYTISYNVDGTTNSTICGSTIIAFPQRLQAMDFIPPSATGLSELPAKVKTSNYFALLLEYSDNKLGGLHTTGYDYLVPLEEIPIRQSVCFFVNSSPLLSLPLLLIL
jgi:hypothetical protein